MSDYFVDREILYTERTRQICEDLPPYVTQFIVGIQMRTTPLTRFAYANDIKIFFNYLLKSRYRNKYTDVKQITLDDLSQLTSFDIEMFLEYLSYYTVDGKKMKCGERAKERKLSALRSFFKYFFNTIIQCFSSFFSISGFL